MSSSFRDGAVIGCRPIRQRSQATWLVIQYEKEGNREKARKICAKPLSYLYLEHEGDVNVALPLAQAQKQKRYRAAQALQ